MSIHQGACTGRNNHTINFTKAQDIGGRSHQEDFIVVSWSSTGLLVGVFDGHDGDECARIASGQLEKQWDLSAATTEVGSTGERLLNTVKSLVQLTDLIESGSTASIVHVGFNKEVWAAVIGDSPVRIQNKPFEWIEAPTHNVRTNEKEREAAVGRGGYYASGYVWERGRGLQLSRSLGDSRMRRILSRKPDISLAKAVNRVIVASDGVLSNVYDFVCCEDAEDLVKTIVQVIPRYDLDNVSAVVIDIR